MHAVGNGIKPPELHGELAAKGLLKVEKVEACPSPPCSSKGASASRDFRIAGAAIAAAATPFRNCLRGVISLSCGEVRVHLAAPIHV